MHKSAVFQWALGGFIGGIALTSFFIIAPLVLWLLLAIGAACLMLRRPRASLAGWTLCAAVLGMWRATAVLSTPSLLSDYGQAKMAVTVEGYVNGDATPTTAGTQYPFHVARIDAGSGFISTDDAIMVAGPAGLAPQYGQLLSLSGKLQVPKDSGDFDYRSYLAKNGIHAQMYFPQYSVPLDWQPSHTIALRLSVVGALHRTRDAVAASIARAVRVPEASYLAGILVGAQGIVSAEVKDIFARTGTSHILAISGYNITVVAAALAAVLAPLGRRRAFWFSTIGIAVFTVMVGASASVVRAAIMGIMALIALQLGRAARAGIAILLSAAFMCAYNPLLLRWDTGFQLSFIALIGIVYLAPLLARPAGGGSADAFGVLRVTGWKANVWNMAATTIAASLMVLPLLLYDFGYLAVYTLPTNLLVLPLVPLAMMLAFATAIGGLVVPLLGALVGQTAWLIAAIQLSIIRFFASLPYATIEIRISTPMLFAAYTGIAALLISVYRRPVLLKENTHG